MKHFDLWQWADFVRDLASPAVQAEMAAHLSSGCTRCERNAATLKAVADVALSEAQYEPPAYAIRLAQAIYPYAPPEKSRLQKLVARLVHDTALAPLPAGIRNQERLSRRALYEAGGYHLDLQLELEPSRGVITLVGQLADRIQPSTSTAEVPVWLMDREGMVKTTVCNELGEFQLEYQPRRHLRLFVPLPEAGKRLEIPLSRLTPGGLRTNGVRRSRRRGPSASS